MAVLSNQQLESDGGGDPPGKLIDLPAKRSFPDAMSTMYVWYSWPPVLSVSRMT